MIAADGTTQSDTLSPRRDENLPDRHGGFGHDSFLGGKGWGDRCTTVALVPREAKVDLAVPIRACSRRVHKFLRGRDRPVMRAGLAGRPVHHLMTEAHEPKERLMRHILPALLAGLVISAAVFGSAGRADAGGNGYNWVPFFCKDHPGDRQCRTK
jgi:hypothetical protein